MFANDIPKVISIPIWFDYKIYESEIKNPSKEFQFQYGSIISITINILITTFIYFNSNMVRL